MAMSVSKSQCPLEESRILRCLANGSVEMEVLKAVNQMDRACRATSGSLYGGFSNYTSRK